MAWRPLFSGQESRPTFLISTVFTPDSYRVYLTDLIHIWGEALSQPAIVERSQNDGTIIELADEGDEENLQVFLQKIRGALEGEHGTTADLQVGAMSQRRTAPSLKLAVTSDVKALGQLAWTFSLEPVPQHTLTDELILPLIRAQRVRLAEEASLIDVLREKDHVIQKLTDKLEAQGTDLGQVFPGAAGKGGRKVTKAWAEERIKGLAVFDEDAWRRATAVEAVPNSKLLAEVFGTSSTPRRSFDGKDTAETIKNWWEGHEESIRLSTSDKKTAGSSNTRKPILPREESNDDFQVQATPPGKTSRRVVEGSKVESTDDEDDDLDAPSQAIPDSFPAAYSTTTKPTTSRLNLSQAVPTTTATDDDHETESEGEPIDMPLRKAPAKEIPIRKPADRKGPFLGDDSTESEGEVLPGGIKADTEIDSVIKNTMAGSEDGGSPARKVAVPVEDVTESEDEVALPRAKPDTKRTVPQRNPSVDDDETDSGSDTLPPKNISTKKNLSQKQVATVRQEDSETEDEQAPPPRESSRAATRSPEQKGNSKPARAKLGGLKKKIPPPAQEDFVSEGAADQPPKKKLGRLRQKGNSTQLQKPKVRLGGLRRKPVMSMSDEEDDEGEADPDEPKKLGGLHQRTPAPGDGGSSRGRTEERIPTPPPRETSEERANKKREQLKRELEEKAAKGPTKKKRKF
ncbi:C6 zinc finger domain-containing protein [Phlyctema vagabunda]|uniref:Non-homologous end-joining factor 1 n=1 Tax=Phlyctema vagabunda TaxID=108571 RepID=A0ABR4PQ31_9HELO